MVTNLMTFSPFYKGDDSQLLCQRKSICQKYECNERLEFLGDAVLELVSSEFLFHNNPKFRKGNLRRRGQVWYVNRRWHSVQEIWILANTFSAW